VAHQTPACGFPAPGSSETGSRLYGENGKINLYQKIA